MDIDLNLSPIVALGCGHGFTYGYLDGEMGISDTYLMYELGEFVGLNDFYPELSMSRPSCPHCLTPTQQFSVLQYDRLVNSAIIDELSR